LILAKGSSNRLPDKNKLEFKGIPMFLHNVYKCLNIFSRVYVSSDDNFILGIAEDVGAIPIKRGEELCGDTPNIPVYRHAAETMNGFDYLVAIQANSPTIDSLLIFRAKQLMEKCKLNELMTCDENYKIYGSIWALSRKRLNDYKDFYNPKPDILLLDNSIDIHTIDDFNKALNQWKQNQVKYW